jgi:hypothetical protein
MLHSCAPVRMNATFTHMRAGAARANGKAAPAGKPQGRLMITGIAMNELPDRGRKAILIDIGGVLVPGFLPDAAALFVDDTPGHVAAAEALGLTGHVHTGAASTMARITQFVGG